MDFRSVVMGSLALALSCAGAAGARPAADAAEWIELPPPGRLAATAVIDPVRDRLVLLGGWDGYGVAMQTDVWTCSLEDGLWRRLDVRGTPPPASDWRAFRDPRRDRIVFLPEWSSPGTIVWTLSLAGTPTWEAMPIEGEGAPVRSDPAIVFDAERDRLLLFGGARYVSADSILWFGDLWSLDLGAPLRWVQLLPDGPRPSPRAGAELVVDEGAGRAILFGGGRDRLNEWPSDLWSLSLTGPPVWTPLAFAGDTAPGRRGHTLVDDPTHGRMLLHGGAVRNVVSDDLWELRLTDPARWTCLATDAGRYGGSCEHVAVRDDRRGRILEIGGLGFANDLWAIVLGDCVTWGRLEGPHAPPPPRIGHSVSWDSRRRRLVVFGGAGPSGYLQDVWVGTPEPTLSWSRLTPSGTPPSARMSHAAVYDSTLDALLVFGGADDAGERNDTWRLSLGDPPTWTRLAPQGAPPAPRSGHTAVLDEAHHRLVLFGGSGGERARDDAWALSLDGTPRWDSLLVQGPAPPAREGHSAVVDPRRGAMWIFGGASDRWGWDAMGDAWWLDLDGPPAWHALPVDGAGPPPRTGHAAAWDPGADRMIVTGGSSLFSSVADTWELLPGDVPTWSPVSVPVAGVDLFGASAAFDRERSRLYALGGDARRPGSRTWMLQLGAAPPAVTVPPRHIVFAGPNPMTDALRIEFDLDTREQVSLAIYDLAGRRVRDLFFGLAVPRRYAFTWDGRDSRGAPLPPGVYVAGLKLSRWIEGRRFVLVR